MALRQQLAPLRVNQLLQAISAHGYASPFARAMGCQAALPPTPATTAQGPCLIGSRLRGESTRQRSDRQMGATADGPGEGEPRGCQSRPSRESWLRPSRTSTSSMSRNATSSRIGVIDSPPEGSQERSGPVRSSEAMFAIRSRPISSVVPVGRRLLTLLLSIPSLEVVAIKCYSQSRPAATRLTR